MTFFDSPIKSQQAAGVRTFIESDAPAVAELFRKVFLSNASSKILSLPTASIASSLTEAFTENPWYTDDLSSLVYEGKTGEVVGFLGVSMRKMVYNNRSIRVAISAHHMISPDCREPLVGIQLLKRFFGGPQDLSLTDGATFAGRKVWEGVGGSILPLQSLSWVRTLRPADEFLNLASGKLKPISLLKPLTGPCNSFLTRRMPHRFGVQQPELEHIEMDSAMLCACLDELGANYSLHPDYDETSAEWTLKRAAGIRGRGELRKVALKNADRQLVGWFIYYLNPGGESQVVQFGARKETAGQVLNALFYSAWEGGSISIEGRLDRVLMAVAAEKHCNYKCGEPWVMVHSRHDDILQSVFQGDAFLSTLDGELCTSFHT